LKTPFGDKKCAIFDHSEKAGFDESCRMVGMHQESGRIVPKAGRLACMHKFRRI